VIDGQAGVYSAGQHIAAIGPGSIVGEMALVGHKPRNASVVADTPMQLLAFNIAAFKKLLEEMPGTRDVVTKVLEARAEENRNRG
jgi:CRP-like cAMP-binding protein